MDSICPELHPCQGYKKTKKNINNNNKNKKKRWVSDHGNIVNKTENWIR